MDTKAHKSKCTHINRGEGELLAAARRLPRSCLRRVGRILDRLTPPDDPTQYELWVAWQKWK